LPANAQVNPLPGNGSRLLDSYPSGSPPGPSRFKIREPRMGLNKAIESAI